MLTRSQGLGPRIMIEEAPHCLHIRIAHPAASTATRLALEDLLRAQQRSTHWALTGAGWQLAILLQGSHSLNASNRCVCIAAAALKVWKERQAHQSDIIAYDVADKHILLAANLVGHASVCAGTQRDQAHLLCLASFWFDTGGRIPTGLQSTVPGGTTEANLFVVAYTEDASQNVENWTVMHATQCVYVASTCRAFKAYRRFDDSSLRVRALALVGNTKPEEVGLIGVNIRGVLNNSSI